MWINENPEKGSKKGALKSSVRWHVAGGQVARWPGGQVARWSGGQVARWQGGQVAR